MFKDKIKTKYRELSSNISNTYEIAFGYLFYIAEWRTTPLSGYRNVKRSDSENGIKINTNNNSQIKLSDNGKFSQLSLSGYTTKYR